MYCQETPDCPAVRVAGDTVGRAVVVTGSYTQGGSHPNAGSDRAAELLVAMGLDTAGTVGCSALVESVVRPRSIDQVVGAAVGFAALVTDTVALQ